jgi:hypothetical protein
MEDREYIDRTDYEERRVNSWSWLPLLLIPLFFVFGWVANDAFDRSAANTGPQAGVGGAPFDNEALTPTTPPARFEDATPTGDGLLPDDTSPTITPDTDTDDELDVPVLEQ